MHPRPGLTDAIRRKIKISVFPFENAKITQSYFLGSTNFCEHPLSDFTIGCLQTASPPETKRWPSAVARLLGCQRASATRDAAFLVLILAHDLQDG